MPHIIKLVRSHLFDQGFFVPLGDGEHFVPLVKDDFLSVLQMDDGELKDTRLSDFHLNAKHSARQRVRLAAQVLSAKVADAMVFNDPSPEAKAKSYAVRLFNDFFDVMNS